MSPEYKCGGNHWLNKAEVQKPLQITEEQLEDIRNWMCSSEDAMYYFHQFGDLEAWLDLEK